GTHGALAIATVYDHIEPPIERELDQISFDNLHRAELPPDCLHFGQCRGRLVPVQLDAPIKPRLIFVIYSKPTSSPQAGEVYRVASTPFAPPHRQTCRHR